MDPWLETKFSRAMLKQVIDRYSENETNGVLKRFFKDRILNYDMHNILNYYSEDELSMINVYFESFGMNEQLKNAAPIHLRPRILYFINNHTDTWF